MPDGDHTTIHVVSGKGFYVRALARDLAFELGCEGHISQLRRTRVGQFTLDNSLTPDQLEAMETAKARAGALLPLSQALDDVPTVDIARGDAGAVRLGRAVKLLPHAMEAWRADPRSSREDRLALAVEEDCAVALGEVRAGQFRPDTGFPDLTEPPALSRRMDIHARSC